MKLDEHYSVNYDGTQWILSYEKPSGKINKKTGKEEISKKQWYHNRLSHSIDSYIDKKVSDKETVESVIIELKTLFEELEKMTITK